MLKLNDKIELKELIPVELFLTRKNLVMKEYYDHVYEILQPNLKQMLREQKAQPPVLGILLRYSLGSETKFFHRLFRDYIEIELRNYELRISTDREVQTFAEKLRVNYTNLSPGEREGEMEMLIKGVGTEAKMSRLVAALEKSISKKNDSLVGGHINEELGRVLLRLRM